jgi:ABC-type multidrug transport system fused ATPase/permease subunit
VTHSLAQLSDYDSILVMHQGHVAYHGSPQAMLHYFGVESPEEVYKKLGTQRGEKWNKSWEKHKDSYYSKLKSERIKRLSVGEIVLQQPDDGDLEKERGNTVPLHTESHDESNDVKDSLHSDNEAEDDEPKKREAVETPNIFSQFFTLLGRRWRIFLRNKTQLTLQIVMIVLFPIMVSLFSSKGQDPINKLSSQRDSNLIAELQQRQAVQENHVKVGSAVSGIIMFEVILLGLMGSNNASREIAGERAIAEKEKYGGMSPAAYLASKVAFLTTLVVVQSVWMFIFVDFFWPFRGNSVTHLAFLMLANGAMTSVCLGISALSKTADQASLLSIYLVGFQLPLSGAVLALPTVFENIIRPFISAYWAWSGSLSALNSNVRAAVKVVIDTTLSPPSPCYTILIIHIIVGLALAYYGIKRSQWD